MSGQPLISVIVPIYKVEDYLDKCVQSIVSQTYNNLEIILVDDGSPDRCPEMCDNWANKDNRINVIHKKNGGQADARNVGLDIARGEFIVFVDSDDLLKTNMIEELYDAQSKTDSDIAMCYFDEIDELGQETGNRDYLEQFQMTGVSILKKLAEEEKKTKKWGGINFVVVWNKIYKKNLFKDLRFPVSVGFEDERIFYRILFKCSKVVSVGKPLYQYRLRHGSTMDLVREQKYVKTDLIEALLEKVYFYRQTGLEDIAKLHADVLYEMCASTVYHFVDDMTAEDLKRYAKVLKSICLIHKPSMLRSFRDNLKWRLIQNYPFLYRRVRMGCYAK